jgi:hypothetical protein
MAKKFTRIDIGEIKVYAKKYPLMHVVIQGIPLLSDMMNLMKNINKAADAIEGDYVSVTDMSKFSTNRFLSSIILYGMEKTYKSFLSVKHKSKISFVIVDEKSTDSKFLKYSLQDINNSEPNKPGYNYYFVSSMDQVQAVCEKLL